jgi:phage baseplate assembly protein W
MGNDILGTGLAFPLGVDPRGGIAMVSSESDIDQAIAVILGTAPGERPMRPEFGCGVHDYVFDTIDASTVGRMELEIREALARWEPRIDVLKLSFDLDGVDRGELMIQIDYRIRATNALRNLVYPFYVIPAEEPE